MLMDTLVNIFAADCEDKECKALAPSVDRHANSLRGVRILLAKDNEINQEIAVELLEGAGASVAVANDGLEAVNKMLDRPAASMFDVVLMDVQMPSGTVSEHREAWIRQHTFCKGCAAGLFFALLPLLARLSKASSASRDSRSSRPRRPIVAACSSRISYSRMSCPVRTRFMTPPLKALPT